MMHLKMRLLSFSLLFLGLASFNQSSESCPEKEVVYPCLCDVKSDNLVLKCFPYKEKINLEKLRKILFSLSGKKNVEVLLHMCPWSEANVTIPSHFFSGVGVGIQSLKFEYCEIKGLSTDNQPPLLGLENDLEVLELENSLMGKTVPFVLNFGHLQKLKELMIFKNRIKELGNDWINAPASLEGFSMSENDIEKIGDRAFAKLVNVREFYFDGDALPSLQRSMFPNPAPKLETLYLGNNSLTTLPEDLFSNMPALKMISIIMNDILTLDQRVWQPVWNQLTDIGLIDTPIKCDESLDWIFTIGKIPNIWGDCKDKKNKEGQDMSIMEYIWSKKQE